MYVLEGSIYPKGLDVDYQGTVDLKGPNKPLSVLLLEQSGCGQSDT